MLRLAKVLANLILAVLVLTAVLLVLMPAIYSSSIAAILSGSMLPEMPVGALAVIQPVDQSEIAVGDIIAFNPPWEEPEVMVSHRVIEVVDGEVPSFRTKGDANEGPDLDLIPATHVLGRIQYCIPNLGYFLSYVSRHSRSELGFVFLVGLPSVVLIGSAARDLRSMTSPGRRRVARRTTLMERRKRRRLR